jgi:hypothetical protein
MLSSGHAQAPAHAISPLPQGVASTLRVKCIAWLMLLPACIHACWQSTVNECVPWVKSTQLSSQSRSAEMQLPMPNPASGTALALLPPQQPSTLHALQQLLQGNYPASA